MKGWLTYNDKIFPICFDFLMYAFDLRASPRFGQIIKKTEQWPHYMMYLSLLILNWIFRIILESPQSGESPKPSHFKGSKGHENPLVLFKLGVFFVVLNCIYLSFMQIHAHFYINYIIYYGLLIFCCQNVATHLL